MRRATFSVIHVRRRPNLPSEGWLSAWNRVFRAALGRSGIKASKREGDGATPSGRFHPVRLWWRADRLTRPPVFLPARQIGPNDAWCEDPHDRRYNRACRRAANEPGDRLWRTDGLYDLIVEIDHNTRPRVAGRGSAVFIHVARTDMTPTAGCVSMPAATLRGLLARLGPHTTITIHR